MSATAGEETPRARIRSSTLERGLGIDASLCACGTPDGPRANACGTRAYVVRRVPRPVTVQQRAPGTQRLLL